MTFRGLLDALEAFIKNELRELTLPVKSEEWNNEPLFRGIEVYKQKMPRPVDVEERIPYILLQLLNGVDDIKDGRDENTVNVRIIITIYDEDPESGALITETIVERLRVGLQQAGAIGKYFELQKPFEYIFYPDDTEQYNPYHLAEISTKWKIPPVERKLPFNW